MNKQGTPVYTVTDLYSYTIAKYLTDYTSHDFLHYRYNWLLIVHVFVNTNSIFATLYTLRISHNKTDNLIIKIQCY